MARKQGAWRTRILTESARNHIEHVVQPALEQLQAAKDGADRELQESSGDKVAATALQAQLREMQAFEQRLQKHYASVRERLTERG